MQVHVNARLTSLIFLHHDTYALMHDHVICMFMSHQRKTLKRNPNLACEEQTSNKTWRWRLKSMKREKVETYGIKK